MNNICNYYAENIQFLDMTFKPSLDKSIDGSLQNLFFEMIDDIIDQARVFERIIEKQQMPNYLGI